MWTLPSTPQPGWRPANNARIVDGWANVPAGSGVVWRGVAAARAGELVLPVLAVRKAAVVELRFDTPAGSWLWRRYPITTPETLRLRLAWFRWGGRGPIPRWDAVHRFVVYFRDAGEVQLGPPQLVEGADEAPGLPGVSDLVALLPGARALRAPSVLLVTDAPALDVGALADHLGHVDARLSADLPFLAPAAGPPTLVVTRDDDSMRSFIEGIGRRVDAEMRSHGGTGYTTLGVAIAPYDAAQGAIRATFTHEFVHSWVARHGGVPDAPQTWLHEGLAVRAQLAFHPQDTKVSVNDLTAILDGGPVRNEGGGYLRAARVISLLLDHPAYRPRAPAVFADMAAKGDVALRPRLAILGLDEAKLRAELRR